MSERLERIEKAIHEVLKRMPKTGLEFTYLHIITVTLSIVYVALIFPLTSRLQ